MIAHFLEYLAVEKHYSPRTVESYRNNLYEFCKFLAVSPELYDPAMVDADDVKQWIICLLDEQKQAQRSVKQKLSTIKSFYRFLLRVGAVKVDITNKVTAPKVKHPLPVFFKPSEMKSVTKYDDCADDFLSIRDCLIIEMLYQTGMRRAELLNLTNGNVDLAAAQIRVFGKRRKERILPIGQKIAEQIQLYIQVRDQTAAENGYDTSGVNDPFFVSFFINKLQPLSTSKLYRIVNSRMGEVSTLKKHSPHVLRHTFATAMLDNGADIRSIQTLLGHTSLAATQIYTHTTFEQIKRTYNAAHPRAHKRKE
ncbi:MAG: tyrosine-type recombinase/integrase [Paludibacteraceae bacterium]|nr:tyrosine-type recombinase/integrase [Paludibacteraceae bacterium]